MHSFLIISRDQTERREIQSSICDDKKIDKLDRFRLSLSDEKKSIGIKEIKNIQDSIHLKPLKGNKKAVAIEDAETLTTEAQNSLLKLLEEPPRSTLIFLLSKSLDPILPTIRSRCKIISKSKANTKPTEDEIKEINAFISCLTSPHIKDSLESAEKISKSKDLALVTLEKILSELDAQLKNEILNQENPAKTVAIMKKTISVIKIVETSNANLRLTLENYFLN